MITPIRGRKPIDIKGFANADTCPRLEIITPIRGRKRTCQYACLYPYHVIRNDNPDKGTETSRQKTLPHLLIVIRNDNPDKGTETKYLGTIKRHPKTD